MAPILDKPIAVIGAGAWGSALALLLARNGNIVRLWSHQTEHLRDLSNTRENQEYLPGFLFPENIQVILTLSEALLDVEDILVVVPSQGFRNVLELIRPIVEQPRIAWGTKGLDPVTKNPLHNVVFETFTENIPIAVISGPSFAKEVAAEKPTAVSLAANNRIFLDDLIKRLHNRNFRVYENNDLIGLELCGTIKNILAIAVGIADGLGLGANTRAALITRGLVEMSRFCVVMGAESQTLMSLAGIGDVILTCTDDQSRNRRFGKAVVRCKDIEAAERKIASAIEGLYNVRQVHELAQEKNIDMPITRQVYRILFESVMPEVAVAELLARTPYSESIYTRSD